MAVTIDVSSFAKSDLEAVPLSRQLIKWRRTSLIVLALVVACSLCGLYLFAKAGSSWLIWPAITTFLGGLLLWSVFKPGRVPVTEEYLEQYSAIQAPCRFTFTDDHVKIESPAGYTLLGANGISRVVERSDAFFIETNNAFFVLPRRYIGSAEDEAAIRANINKKQVPLIAS